MQLRQLTTNLKQLPATPRLPTLFIGHGSPVNAVEQNEFTTAWQTVGGTLPTPSAVLCISAHWFADGTYVHGNAKPKTIHDFYGFPKELYDIRYPCPGAPTVAKATQEVVTKTKVGWDEDWGLDHGCWVVLQRLFPKANVPVFQMSIDYTKPPAFHYELAQELKVLRERGVLIISSGNIVHNLGLIEFDEQSKPYDWAIEFDDITKKLITKGDHQALIDYKHLGSAAHLSIPTPDHYLPLIYTLGLQEKTESVKFFAEGLTYKSISMRSLIIQ